MEERALNLEIIDRLFNIVDSQLTDVNFISEVHLEDEDLDLLFEKSGLIINKCSVDGYSHKFNVLASIILVHIGLDDYSEGNYWDGVKNRLDVTVNQTKLGKVFRSVLERYDLPMIEDASRINVTNIIMHTLVPNGYLNNFFDFIYSFYENILERKLDGGIEEELGLLASHVKRDLGRTTVEEENSEELSFHRLLKPTRYALSDESYFSDLVTRILKLINARYWDEPLDIGVRLRRFEDPFNEWYEEKHRKTERKVSKDTYLRSLKPHIVKGVNSLKLSIPRQKLKVDEEAHVTIEKSDGSHPIKIDTYPLGAWRKTYPLERPLERLGLDPFEKFSIKLNGRLIFRNKSDQRFIIFNERGEPTTEPCVGLNHIVLEDDVELDTVDKSGEWGFINDYRLVSLVLSIGDYLMIDGELFEVGISEQMEYKKYVVHGAGIIDQGHRQDLVNKHPVIFLKTGNLADSDHLRIIGNETLKNIDLRHYLKNDSENKGGIIKVDINENVRDTESGNYRVLLLGEEKQKRIVDYYIIEGFDYKFDESAYLNRDHGKIRIRSEDIIPQFYRWKGDSFSLELLPGRNELFIPTPVFKLSIKDDEWLTTIKNRVSTNDLTEDHIRISYPNASHINLYISYDSVGKKRRKVIPGIKDKDHFVFDIAGLKDTMLRMPERDYLFEISVDSKPRMKFLEVVTHFEYRVVKDGDTLMIHLDEEHIPDHVTPTCAIYDHMDELLIEEFPLECGMNPVENLNNQYYSVRIFENIEDFFNTDRNLIVEKKFGEAVYVDEERSRRDRNYTHVCYEDNWLMLENSLIDAKTGELDKQKAERDFRMKHPKNSKWLTEDVYSKMVEKMRTFLVKEGAIKTH